LIFTILNQLVGDFDLKSFLYKVIVILIWNHFTSDFTHHWYLRL